MKTPSLHPKQSAEPPSRSSRLLRGMLYLLLSLAIILTVGIAAIIGTNHDYLQNEVAQYLTEKLQREVSIAGSLNITVGRTLEISVRDASIASVEWSEADSLLRVASADIVIDARSLLADEIIIESLLISGLHLNLEKQDADTNNWGLAFGDENNATDERPTVPIRFNRLEVNQVTAEYRAPELTDPLQVELNSITQIILANETAELGLSGKINAVPLSLSAVIADINNFNRLQEVGVRFSGNLGEITLDGDASFDDLLEPSKPAAVAQLTGPNIDYLTDIIGLDNLPPGPLALDLSIKPKADAMIFSSTGKVSTVRFAANGSFDDLQLLTNAQAEFSLTGEDLGRLAAIGGIEGLPAQPFSLEGGLNIKGDTVDLTQTSLELGDAKATATAHFDQFPSPRGATATASIDGPRIEDFGKITGLSNDLRGPFTALLQLVALEDGSADVSLVATDAASKFRAKGNLKEADGFAGSVLTIDFSSNNLAHFADVVGTDMSLPNQPVTLSAVLDRAATSTQITNGEISVGKDTLSVSGVLGDEAFSSATRLDLNIAIPQLQQSLAAFGVASNALPTSAFQATTTISGRKDGIEIASLDAKLGDASVNATGTVSEISKQPAVQLRYAISGADLAIFLPDLQKYDALQSPFSITGQLDLNKTLIAFNDIDASISDANIEGDIAMDRAAPLESFSAKINASSPDVFALAAGLADIQGPKDIPMRLSVQGDLAKMAVNLEQLDLRIGKAKLIANGRVTEPPGYSGTNLKVSATAPNIANIGKLTKLDLPADALALDFRLTNESNQLTVNNLRATLGNSDLQGKLTLASGDVPAVTVALQSAVLDLSEYTKESNPQIDDTDNQQTDSDGRLIPNVAIPFDLLSQANIDFDVRADKLIDSTWRASNVVLAGSVKDSVLNVTRLELIEENGGELSARFKLRPSENGGELGMRVIGSDLELGLPAEDSAEAAALPQYNVRIAFITEGQTVRDMAGAVNGYMQVVFGPGSIKTIGMNMFTNDFLSQLLTTINPFLKSDPYTELECSVISATVENGQLDGNPALVAKSDRLMITAKAQIDLKTEKLSADINTVAQKGLGLSLNDLVNPYIKLKGTLGKPTLALDKQSAVIEGGAAVATAGISILAKNFANRFLSSKDPCGTAVTNAEKSFALLEEKYGATR